MNFPRACMRTLLALALIYNNGELFSDTLFSKAICLLAWAIAFSNYIRTYRQGLITVVCGWKLGVQLDNLRYHSIIK